MRAGWPGAQTLTVVEIIAVLRRTIRPMGPAQLSIINDIDESEAWYAATCSFNGLNGQSIRFSCRLSTVKLPSASSVPIRRTVPSSRMNASNKPNNNPSVMPNSFHRLCERDAIDVNSMLAAIADHQSLG